jgi:hypothetical protein
MAKSETSKLKDSIRKLSVAREIDPPDMAGLSVGELSRVRTRIANIRTPVQAALVKEIKNAARSRDIRTPATGGLSTNALRSLKAQTVKLPTITQQKNAYVARMTKGIADITPQELKDFGTAYLTARRDFRSRNDRNAAAAALNNDGSQLDIWDENNIYLTKIFKARKPESRRNMLDAYLMLSETQAKETGTEYKYRAINEFRKLLIMSGIDSGVFDTAVQITNKGNLSSKSLVTEKGTLRTKQIDQIFNRLVRVNARLGLTGTNDWYDAIYNGGISSDQIETAINNDLQDYH